MWGRLRLVKCDEEHQEPAPSSHLCNRRKDDGGGIVVATMDVLVKKSEHRQRRGRLSYFERLDGLASAELPQRSEELAAAKTSIAWRGTRSRSSGWRRPSGHCSQSSIAQESIRQPTNQRAQPEYIISFQSWGSRASPLFLLGTLHILNPHMPSRQLGMNFALFEVQHLTKFAGLEVVSERRCTSSHTCWSCARDMSMVLLSIAILIVTSRSSLLTCLRHASHFTQHH